MISGLHAREKLNEAELDAIGLLADTCNRHDRIELKLNWNMLRERSGSETSDFLYYESGQLVGFLGVYQFLSTEVELSGMVHPSHRRQGLFGQMVQAAREECKRRNVSKLVFMCQQGSSSAKAVMDRWTIPYGYSEYWMGLSDPRPQEDREQLESLKLREFDSADESAIVRLNVEGFGLSEEDATNLLEKPNGLRTSRVYMAEVQGEEGIRRTVGKIHVRIVNGSAFIYGFVVAANERGRGYGKAILKQIIKEIRAEDPQATIALEVAVKNEQALGLYESTGFRISKATDYYEWTAVTNS
ncbi:GNAT family N-acetyltransferase [Paenibacillus paeoniae]|uniref:GNAT family N-acetyltransferase n=1 Tax=Paenibacillus paeoniae TaxID=2292705 RepID=A0A371P8L5_9BACL|nr:GNAT family N-acetyltransferase [Paenibacillus paeoniae]REK71878.1 GNAT family N-acetyltransferase [Paenibacillus paeoniae]